MHELTGKSALITGATRGIGAATAIEFATHGVNVVLFARRHDALQELVKSMDSLPGRVVDEAGDVSNFTDLQRAVNRCVTEFGSIDILVNNAGVIEPVALLADAEPEAWDHVVDINLKGVFHGMRAALPVMLAQRSGVIVNLSSGAATGVLEGWSHSCATKAAVLALTRCAHLEYAEHGVRVIGLSPGTVATDMQIIIKASGINRVSQLDPSVHIPPEWPARAITWLCTSAASPFDGTDFSIKTDEGRRLVGLIDATDNTLDQPTESTRKNT